MPDKRFTPEIYRVEHYGEVQAADDWAAYYAWVTCKYTVENNMYLESISQRLKNIEGTMKNEQGAAKS